MALFQEDIALRFCRRDLGMLVQFLTGYNFLNWYSTLSSFHYSIYVKCILSWGRALGPLGGLSTVQLNCCLPRMEVAQALCCVLTKHSTASLYNPTDQIIEACRGQCTNKQSVLICQIAFYKTSSGSMNAHVS